MSANPVTVRASRRPPAPARASRRSAASQSSTGPQGSWLGPAGLPRFDEPLVVQIAYRREQLDRHRRLLAWWDDELTSDQRNDILAAYRRSNGGFGNATDAMAWFWRRKTPTRRALRGEGGRQGDRQ